MLSPCGFCERKNWSGSSVVLEQESVICSHEEVRGVGVGRLLDQVDEVTKCVICCFEDLTLGAHLVAGRVNSVVVDVQHLAVLEQFSSLVGAKSPEVLRLDRCAADSLEDLRARAGAVRGLDRRQVQSSRRLSA